MRAFIFLMTNIIGLSGLWAQSTVVHTTNRKEMIREIGEMKGQQKHGLWVTIKREGNYKRVHYYEQGKKIKRNHNIITNYYDGKTPESIGEWVYSKKQGLWVFFNEEGVITKAAMYVNDKEEGAWFTYEDGQLAKSGFLKNGQKDGEWLGYHYGGEIHKKQTYKDGIQMGKEEYFHPNGKLRSLVHIVNGNKSGDFKEYYANGALELEGQYDAEGKRTGVWKEYYESGKLREVYGFQSDKWHGEYVRYYENGKLEIKGTYNLDQPVDTFKRYDENGNESDY